MESLPRAHWRGCVGGRRDSYVRRLRRDSPRSGRPSWSHARRPYVFGVLRSPPTARTPLVFEFVRTGSTPATCTASTNPVDFDATTGAFSIEVPITCPTGGGRAFFNGDPVTYTVRLGSTSGELLTTTPLPVTPVPYARFADQAGVNNDCPAGYLREPEAGLSSDVRLCVRRRAGGGLAYDQVVRVGTGAAAFWIDRYEAMVTAEPEARGSELGGFTGIDDYGDTFPDNGQWTAPRYAFSLSVPPGRVPSRFITWFQASEACAVSGKRLPTGEEWLRAANGTADSSPGCNISTRAPRNPGGGAGCRSRWGAEDMVGNLFEWTAEWYASVRLANSLQRNTVPQIVVPPDGGGTFVISSIAPEPLANWPATGGSSYRDDGTTGVVSAAFTGPSMRVDGVPSAAIRGGAWDSNDQAGIFAFDVNYAPSMSNEHFGFRCVIPR